MPPKQQPQRQLTRSSPSSTSGVVGSGKPPRPLRETGSLDRRRNLSTSRHERDGKSRSTHSLKEKSSSSDLHKHDSLSSNLSLNSKDQLHDSGSFNNYNSSGSGSLHQQRHQHQHNPRHSPSIWEPPPPPPLAHWDPHYYWGYPHYHHQHQHQSREELRLIDYHRRQQELYQYGSNSNLGSAQDLSCSSGCCNRGYFPPPFPPPPGACCSYDQRPQCSKEFQRQDTDERLRRLQTDKEALAMQVKTLTEQVQSQSTKISELERTVKEKNQLLSNAEDLLQREMLSRSSLETQKLELMSAMSELKLQQAALERENLELRTNFVTSTGGLMNGSLTSSSNGNGSPLTNVLNNNSISMLRRPQIITNTRMVGMSASTPGNSLNFTSSGSSTATDSNANPRRNVAFAESENGNEDRSEGVPPARSYTPQPSPSPSMSNKLKNIFGKIKRSNSGTLEDLAGADSEFKRGGIRATAGARLGWSGTVPYRKPDKPFREWELDAVCQWFDHLGLNMYEEELRRWLKSSMAPAVDLIKASPVDIEKELNLRNPLHRKKIVLAVADISGTEDEDELFKAAGMLDTAWILRWLDDIGMPQYKDTFTAARMDGRMLHKLTFDDLATLQMSSCLHVASIRRGIQLMRHEKWQPDCLVRRPLPPDTNAKDDVRLWTSQRVHEWLRVVDLAEYSPNLRGSGVHGALMIFEVKFTAELFADLLSIPASKTLLRRHLATHFKDLLGRDIIQVKREAENTLGFQPLTISSKIKTPKKSQFSLKRKKSAKGGQLGEEWSDYVCPMGGSGQEHLPSATYASSTNNSTNNSNVSPGASTAFTSNASSNANPNNVTSIGMTKNPSMVPTACPGSTTSSTTSTTTFGVESEPVSLPPQPLSSVMSQMIATGSGTNGGGCGSDSPVSTRSSTTNLLNCSRSVTTTGSSNTAAGNLIASFSPVKDVYKSSSANHSNYSSSSSLVSCSSRHQSVHQSTVTMIGIQPTGATATAAANEHPVGNGTTESNIPVQRSASFNSTCTVPLSISKMTHVKNSASFSNCSILSKVTKKGAGLTASITAHPLLKFSSSSATNLLKQQTSNGPSCSANSISNTYTCNITEALANAGSNTRLQSAARKSSTGSLSSSTGQLPSPSTASLSSTTSIVTSGAAVVANATGGTTVSLNQSTSTTALSLAQIGKNSITDYYV
ncbi:AGAP010342-PA-like protein [Anopheles sinensis]|uniref:AGAP010342-PA-like protein n=1 Tax=Anopheles sinensis TaxID=74873 RepID=A0A084VJX1_ANOSI|nr:AGAP010342-PA-like protein [Anopheles sinensis]